MKEFNDMPHFKSWKKINNNYNNKTNNCSVDENHHILSKTSYAIGKQGSESNCTQLFTQLKLNKYNSHAQQCESFSQMAKIQCNSNDQNHMRYANVVSIIDQSEYIQQQNLDKLNANSALRLREQQLKKLSTLKSLYVKYLVKEHLETGRKIKQILQTDVMTQLEQQIRYIVEVENQYCQDDNNLKVLTFAQELYPVNSDLEKNNKNLQSTAEYWEQSAERQFTNLNSKNKKNLTIDIQSVKQPLSQNMVRLSANRKGYQENEFHSFERKQHNGNQHMKETINIIQFTLGSKENEDNSENFTQREQLNAFQGVNQLKNPKCGGRSQQKIVCQFMEMESGKQQNLNLPQKTSKTYEMLKNSCKSKVPEFNRKKIPKGKAIKNRVMGNFDIQSIQM